MKYVKIGLAWLLYLAVTVATVMYTKNFSLSVLVYFLGFVAAMRYTIYVLDLELTRKKGVSQ